MKHKKGEDKKIMGDDENLCNVCGGSGTIPCSSINLDDDREIDCPHCYDVRTGISTGTEPKRDEN